MHKRFLLSIMIIILPVLTAIVYITAIHHFYQTVIVQPPVKPRFTAVVLPLDSRPPCTQFVEQLANTADIRVLLPPAEIMDHYNTPGNKNELKKWLITNAKQADIAIVSTDMIIHGSLLSSRLSHNNAQDSIKALRILKDIHSAYPRLKIYAFNTIPRLTIGANKKNDLYRNKMHAYSQLKDQYLIFDNPATFHKLIEIEKKIPPEYIANYLTLIDTNIIVNEHLINLTKQGVLAGLIIGQDDSEPFGFTNMAKRKLTTYLNNYPELNNKVFITCGADEVAMTLLQKVAQQKTKYRPRIFVQYSTPTAQSMIMPFMPQSVGTTVQEKITAAGGVITTSRKDADFTLYIHVGTRDTTTESLDFSAQEIKVLIKAGYKIALVDLSKNFKSRDTLLPYLLKNQVPLTSLVAYAGWNTASNSIGTALAQASLFTLSLKEANDLPSIIRSYKYNLEFLTARILDDWYYQKSVQPALKKDLESLHIENTNLAKHYAMVNLVISHLLGEQAELLYRQAFINKPLIIENRLFQKIVISNIHSQFSLPWERIFEIKVSPSVELSIFNKKLLPL